MKRSIAILISIAFAAACTSRTAKTDADIVQDGDVPVPDLSEVEGVDDAVVVADDDVAEPDMVSEDADDTADDDALLSDADEPTTISCGTEPFLAKEVSAGESHTCAVASDGSLWCWGYNHCGQLGTGDTVDTLCPTRVGNNTDWVMVAVNEQNSCGIKTDGTLWCWGLNNRDQLGLNDNIDRHVPTLVDSELPWKHIMSGQNGHHCGIKSDDTMWCWGWNVDGQVGIDSELTSIPIPTPVLGKWQSVDGGHGHTCAVKMDGTLWCAGDNWYGQLGIGEWGYTDEHPDSYRYFLQINDEKDWAQITIGWANNCALKNNGNTYCWGNNYHGQLGIDSKNDQNAPQIVDSPNVWIDIVSGNVNSCAIDEKLLLWCWGSNYVEWGSVGDGGYEDRLTPVNIMQDTTWQKVSSGGHYSCAIQEDRLLRCWGGNEYGQLGLGDKETRRIPTPLMF